MELGDGDPEGQPRKGGEVFSKGEKNRLSTPDLSPHSEGPEVRATHSCSPFLVTALVFFPPRPSRPPSIL